MNKELDDAIQAIRDEADKQVEALTECMNVAIDGIHDVRNKQIAALKQSRPWEPTKHDCGFLINYHGAVEKCIGINVAGPAHHQGRVFETREQAEAYRDREQARIRVERRIAELDADKPPLDWNNHSQTKHYPRYSHESRKINIGSASFSQTSPTEWHGGRATIETVIEEMPEDIKLMLGVGE